MAIYFTPEEAPRRRTEGTAPEMKQAITEMAALSIGEQVFLDLRDPWLHAPG
jgi:hypothetical protein